MKSWFLRSLGVVPWVLVAVVLQAQNEVLEAPESVPRFDPAEFVLRLANPPKVNPFTDVEFTGQFSGPNGRSWNVVGFCDAEDGSVFRLRFSPMEPGHVYTYRLTLRWGGVGREFSGRLKCVASNRPGPVVADPNHPRHFIHLGNKAWFYHLGFTAYHLLDVSNDDAQVDATIRYAAALGFNKIRFLLTGYPRDFDRRSSSDVEHGVPDPWRAPNYGAKPGQVNPLPAWVGKPHAYDFTRFNVHYWQRVERAVKRMREFGIVATCIVTIEKQDLPKEYGALTDHEFRLYRYALARLGAFDNVWWDLGNEHNEYRDIHWGNAMGTFISTNLHLPQLISAHGYADFHYADSPWAGFIITQQYGDEKAVHDWALKYASFPKPYVNEEYGYEGQNDKPGHGQNCDWVRCSHWSIAMAGGYATYGDWSDGISYFYMGEPGPGRAALQLRHLRKFFEALPFYEFQSVDQLTTNGFCLARRPDIYVLYFPKGGQSEVELPESMPSQVRARWFDPRDGHWEDGPTVRPGRNQIRTPNAADWVLLIRTRSS